MLLIDINLCILQLTDFILISLQKIIFIDLLKKTLMASSEDQNILTHTKKLGNSEFQVFCKSHAETAHLIFSIQKYLKKYPSFYYNSILSINKGRSIDIIQKRLDEQLNKLIHQKSFYHTITRALSSRQKCIQKIKAQLTRAERVLLLFKKQYINEQNSHHSAYLQYVEQQGYSNVQVDQTIQNSIKLISSVFIDISRLREMTIYLVQTIHRWKVELQEWADKCNQYEPIFFYHQNQNIYDIVIQDTNFIWQSTLSQYICISIKNDPFMIRNVIQVQKLLQKTILQKYFIQILYPKSENTISKAIKCHQMLTYKYKPDSNNLYREEQLLIENYLSLRKKQQNEEGIQQISQIQHEWQDSVKKKHNQKLHSKGWIFGKTLKKPSTQKVKQIIERHQQKITFIKPFNISNYSERKSLALAYIAQSNNQSPIKKALQNVKSKQISKIYRTHSTYQLKRTMNSQRIIQKIFEKGYNSQQQVSKKKFTKMYQSLLKLSPVILQDPRQDIEEKHTPKYKSVDKMKIVKRYPLTQTQLDTKQFLKTYKMQQQNKKINKQKVLVSQSQNQISSIVHKTKTKTKIKSIDINFHKDEENSQQIQIHNIQKQVVKNKQDSQDKSLNKIQVQSEQEQINFGQFLQNFRQNTNKPNKIMQVQKQKAQLRKIKIQQNQKKLKTIRQIIDLNRIENQFSNIQRKSIIFNVKSKSPYVSKSRITPQKKSNSKEQNGQHTNRTFAENSFSDYKKIQTKQIGINKNHPFKFEDDFIVLNSKSIPIDIVPDYLRHLFSQIHSTSKKFTLYSYKDLLKKLQDPYNHCIVFEISTQKKGLIGQVILSETFGVNNKKLKYTIQFINIHMFEMVVAAILRIAEELLYATPCQQVICPLIQDRLDPVSTHFIHLIETVFKSRVQSFGQLTILQKKKIYYKQTELHERLSIFSSNNKKVQQIKISKAMMGNYRPLKFQCKCLMLSSNFRMRSKSIQKNVISNYQNVSLGYLYRKVLQKIITKFHLKQMKVSSIHPNQNDQISSLVKQSSFLRTLITTLVQYLKQQIDNQQDLIYLTRFQNMSEVLTYLDYKQYSEYFYFNFLEQSRFILNHELFITEFQMDFSLQFMVRSSIDFLILYNNHNLPIKVIEPSANSRAKAVILPTTHDEVELILIDGHQFELQTTDKLDLFSYLYIYQQANFKYQKIVNEVKQIVIPNIHKTINSINTAKMFDGLFRLFPQRQFYSGTYFKCTNLWESYFPSAVVYKPQLNSIVFQYPLIVGFLHKKTKKILTSFLLKNII